MALPLITADELVSRLASDLAHVRREQPRARPYLAFDADGTLWSGDVGEEGFAQALSGRVLLPAAGPALREVARAHGIAEDDDVHRQAELLWQAHTAGRLPERDAYMLMSWGFAGRRPDEMLAFAERVITGRGAGSRHHAELAPVLDWARGERLELWVVSASPQAIVEQGVRRLGIGRHTVLAMRPRVVDGLLAPELEGFVTYADGKADALARTLTDGVLLAAFGDNSFDVAMLRQARHPVAVRPKPALLDHPELPDSIVQLIPA